MTRWKRLLFYIGLNIVISGLTTLSVLWIWDRTHVQTLPAAQPLVAQAGEPAAPIPTATLPPIDRTVIEVKNVFGVGDLANEVVVIQRSGEGDLSLTGWRVEDENGSVYTFTDLLLNKSGGVQLYTKAGVDSVIELYWGRSAPVWKSGEQVRLFDWQNNLRATYTIP